MRTTSFTQKRGRITLDLENCIGLLLSFKTGPVEVFVSRKASRT